MMVQYSFNQANARHSFRTVLPDTADATKEKVVPHPYPDFEGSDDAVEAEAEDKDEGRDSKIKLLMQTMIQLIEKQ